MLPPPYFARWLGVLNSQPVIIDYLTLESTEY
jgi:hypothetical protein